MHDENTLVLENLKKLNPFTYDSIIILSQDPTEEDAEKVDSDTLMILAQLSEEPKIKKLYDDIFQEDGSEIYVKPAMQYFT